MVLLLGDPFDRKFFPIRIDSAIERRFVGTYGEPGDCFESFVEVLAELVEKWQAILYAEDEEELAESAP